MPRKMTLAEAAKPRRQAPEQDLQKVVAAFLDQSLLIGTTWFAINPIPAKSKAAAGLSKALGLKAGTPDLCIVHQGRAVFIELKAKGGRVSDAQVVMMQKLTDAGAGWQVCDSLESVERTLLSYGIPLRARLAA